MQTVLNWHDPDETPPPFGERILIVTKSWDLPSTNRPPVLHFDAVKITRLSPNDDIAGSEYEEWASGSEFPFTGFQFELRDQSRNKIEEYYSDAIVLWSALPELAV